MKRKWEICPPNLTLQETLSRELGISPLTAQVLANRGINQIDQAYQFLHPSLSHLHPPLLMKDMQKAVDRIIQALSKREQVLIYGDYDVDGVTSTAILILFFNSLQFPCRYYIPHRIERGYGLHGDIVEKFAHEGVSLIITADCGISDVDPVRRAQEMGVDVIVTDHHEISEEVPPAYSVINPKQGDCSFPFESLAGVGVVFNLIIALRAKLRERGAWGDGEVPNLRRYLDLVAMGTVADLVPLQGENRIFVRFGLEELTKGNRLGIRVLKESSGLKESVITTGSVGFRLAPRINAAGRLGEPQKGVELLLAQDRKTAEEIARELTDRYGSLPSEAYGLLDKTRLKIYASRLGLEAVFISESYCKLDFGRKIKYRLAPVSSVLKDIQGEKKILSLDPLSIILKPPAKSTAVEKITAALARMAEEPAVYLEGSSDSDREKLS